MGTFHPLEPLRGWRRVATQAWRAPQDPSVYAFLDLPMRPALAFIEQAREETGVHLTVTHLVAKGIALSIRRYPQLNGIVAGGRIMLRDTVDMFLQVSTEGGSDLSGVKIERIDEKPVVEVARECAARVEKLRQKRDQQVERTKSMLDHMPLRLLGPVLRGLSYLTYDWDLDLSRFGVVRDSFGSAMITNVGMFGLSSALAPLVPFSRTPLVILIGDVQDRPVAEAGRVVVRPMVTIGVTFDHRFMDGWQGGAMAQVFRAYMENPAEFERGDGVAAAPAAMPSR